MKDGKYINIIFLIILSILLCLCGCIENNNDDNQDNDNDQQITKSNFIGTWNGTQIQNDIPIDIILYENNTGFFQEISITWEYNQTTLILGMYNGESPSYYSFEFSESNQQLNLENKYSNETFNLMKKN